MIYPLIWGVAWEESEYVQLALRSDSQSEPSIISDAVHHLLLVPGRHSDVRLRDEEVARNKIMVYRS